MADDIRTKIENYKTAPFDARFPHQNQTRHCFQNYLGPPQTCCECRMNKHIYFHRCEKSLKNKGQDPYPCQWYFRVYTSMCPSSWVEKWDEQREAGTFPSKI